MRCANNSWLSPLFQPWVSWEANQVSYKPDTGYGYWTDGTTCWNGPLGGLYTITDSREIMSFVARPRSYAVGAQPGIGGPIQGGEIDLAAQFGFGNGRADHSGQFTRP